MKELTFCAVALAAAAGIIGCSSDAGNETAETLTDEEAGLTISIGGGGDDDDDLSTITIDPKRELLITDLSVVEDPVRTKWPAGTPVGPQAAWTFGRLMQKMAGAQNASQFCLEWLKMWELDQTINGYLAPARPNVQTLVIGPWLQASGGQELDLKIAPFRLLAIVNRLDLRSKSPNGQISAGEGRFVFGFVKPDGSPSPFTIIFEYNVRADSEYDVIDWAKDWHELGEEPFGPKFNASLQKLTDKFSGPNCPGKPNNSCLNQLRTNEVSLDPNKVWELRDYRLVGNPAKIVAVPMVLTPDGSHNGTSYLADYINTNAALIKQRQHSIDPTMLGATSFASLLTPWNAPGITDPEARHSFALSTCNGCHTAETGTNFTHVKNRAAGVESKLSGYMTGITVNDPVSGVSRTFNELASRAQDMAFVLEADDDDLFQGDDDDDDDDDNDDD